MEFLQEEWVDCFAGKIPADHYTLKLEQGEENGLVATLESKHRRVVCDFGLADGVNVLEEGVLLNDCPLGTSEKDILPAAYSSTLYRIQNGKYAQYIRAYMGEDLFDFLKFRQYNLDTLNFVVMIVTRAEPWITVYEKS